MDHKQFEKEPNEILPICKVYIFFNFPSNFNAVCFCELNMLRVLSGVNRFPLSLTKIPRKSEFQNLNFLFLLFLQNTHLFLVTVESLTENELYL